MIYLEDAIGFALEVCTPDGKILYSHNEAVTMEAIEKFESLIKKTTFVCDEDKYIFKESEVSVCNGSDYAEFFDYTGEVEDDEVEDSDYPEILLYSIIVIRN